jgi:hypothetical protein
VTSEIGSRSSGSGAAEMQNWETGGDTEGVHAGSTNEVSIYISALLSVSHVEYLWSRLYITLYNKPSLSCYNDC